MRCCRAYVLTQSLDGRIQRDLAAVDLITGLLQQCGDVGVRHAAEQLILFAGLLLGSQRELGEQRGQFLRGALLLRFAAQRGLPLLFHDLLVGLGRRNRQSAGQQEIAGIAIGHLHQVAAAAQIVNVVSQNDFHRWAPRLRVGRERQQRDVAGLLHGFGEHALMSRADAGNAAGQDLALFS